MEAVMCTGSPGARGRTDFSQKMREELLATVERLCWTAAGGSRCCTVGLSLVHRRSCREDRLRLLVLRRSSRPEMLLELRSPGWLGREEEVIDAELGAMEDEADGESW
ncbi:hypothetical protein H0E87_006726 [Populus deltoides]|uniref:Uncharacterized protein n=1 Tax=Populus deltoides TaxID=3696 RepID=A0A8T2Z896_POPDE|nr:hypothetical protein H0E87_006726 [Populus deltoides]